jgi:hypothetical protein
MRQPWRLTFQYDSQDKPSHRAHYDAEGAERMADEFLETARYRESTVTLLISNRDTGESYTYPRSDKGENMTGRADVTEPDGVKVIEQIDANVERLKALAAERSAEAVTALVGETEELIASLSGKGSIAIKKDKRAAVTAAADIPADAPKAEVATAPKEGVVVAKDYTEYAGVVELRDLGAERVAEGVRLHMKAGDLATEVAKISVDIWLRLPGKDDNPDIMGTGGQAQAVMQDLYTRAGKGFKDSFDTKESLTAFTRAVQYRRTDIRAQVLRSLDDDTAEGAERRELFAGLLAKKPKNVPASEFVAKHYGTGLKGAREIAKERAEKGTPKEIEQVAPDEKLPAIIKAFESTLAKISLDEVASASEDVREAQRTKLNKIYKEVKALIAATL